MRKCPFNDCEEVIGDHLFACRRHWYSLNLTERQEVYAAYNDYTSDTIGVEELRRKQQEVLGERGTA